MFRQENGYLFAGRKQRPASHRYIITRDATLCTYHLNPGVLLVG